MQIRLADLNDLNTCVRLEDTFETDYVWQMEEQNRNGAVNVNFRVTRLPRPMRVTGVISKDDVVRNYQNGGVLFVADVAGVCGFLDVIASEWNQVAYINNLLIAPEFRRKGIGTQLMSAALDWGRLQKLRTAMLDTSTKNHPAICFYQKLGFTFCGFNDQLYPNRDIALYYSLALR